MTEAEDSDEREKREERREVRGREPQHMVRQTHDVVTSEAMTSDDQ